MHLTDVFIQSDLQCIQVYIFSICVPWELNPRPFALQTQCSNTEPQEHFYIYFYVYFNIYIFAVFAPGFHPLNILAGAIYWKPSGHLCGLLFWLFAHIFYAFFSTALWRLVPIHSIDTEDSLTAVWLILATV